MKKSILFGACMLSLLAGVSSCSNDEVADNNGATGKQISITAGISNGAEARVAYEDNGSKVTVSWSDSESFTMYQGTGSTGTEFSKSTAGNVFQGTLPTGSGTYYGVYGTDIINTDGVLTVDLSSQTGTNAENGIKEFMVAEATDLNQSMTFAHKLAVLKLTLTLPGDVEGTVSKVSISGMHNKADYKLGDTDPYTYIDDNKGEIVASGNNGEGFTISDDKKIIAYIAVFPETVVANKIEITAQVGTDYYGYTLKSEKTLVAGNVIPVSVALTKKDINFRKKYAVSDYYRWDAYCGLGVGSADVFNENNSGYNPENVASHSCASCPTAQEMVNYIAAGCYWDDGSDGEGKLSCTVPTGNNGNSTKEVTKGLWLLKKAYITSAGPTHTEGKIFSGGSYMTNFSSLDADEIKYIRTSGKYFFLPAAGNYSYYDLGDSGIISRFDRADISGCYWLSTPCAVGNDVYALYFFSNAYGSAVNVIYGSRGDNGYLPMVAE